jgi:hypothetical protein
MGDEQQLDNSDFGRSGIEKSQGWTPMPEAAPAEERAVGEGPLDEGVRRHLERPNQPEPLERAYFDNDGSGNRRPENESITAERASDNLRDIRAAEKAELDRQLNDATSEAVDALRQQVTGEQPPQSQSQPQQQPAQEQQPDLELQPEQAQAQAAWTEVDRKVEEVLADPLIRERFEQAINHERQQAAAQVLQAKASYEQAVTQNALVGLAVLNSAFPELAGLNPEQINGALRVMRPERAEQYRQHVGQISTLVEGYQRQAGALQQQQQAQTAQQQQQAAHQLEQFRVSEVKRFEAATANIPPETLRNIADNVMPTVEKHYGLKEADMRDLISGRQKVDSQAFMHSMPFQLMLMEAVRFRMSQDALPRAVNRPVPQVQRPGISEPSRSDDGEVAAAWAKLNSNNKGLPGIRAAAEIVAARRRARG